MKDLFNDVLSISGVQGVILFSGQGNIIYDSIEDQQQGKPPMFKNWKKLFGILQNTHEADFVFEKGRFYLRRLDDGFLLILMQSFASIAMVKLNCDILLPQIKTSRSSRGLKALFKR